jgi:hypothetical protein
VIGNRFVQTGGAHHAVKIWGFDGLNVSGNGVATAGASTQPAGGEPRDAGRAAASFTVSNSIGCVMAGNVCDGGLCPAVSAVECEPRTATATPKLKSDDVVLSAASKAGSSAAGGTSSSAAAGAPVHLRVDGLLSHGP